jgi:hypothetical protein
MMPIIMANGIRGITKKKNNPKKLYSSLRILILNPTSIMYWNGTLSQDKIK